MILWWNTWPSPLFEFVYNFIIHLQRKNDISALRAAYDDILREWRRRHKVHSAPAGHHQKSEHGEDVSVVHVQDRAVALSVSQAVSQVVGQFTELLTPLYLPTGKPVNTTVLLGDGHGHASLSLALLSRGQSQRPSVRLHSLSPGQDYLHVQQILIQHLKLTVVHIYWYCLSIWIVIYHSRTTLTTPHRCVLSSSQRPQSVLHDKYSNTSTILGDTTSKYNA